MIVPGPFYVAPGDREEDEFTGRKVPEADMTDLGNATVTTPDGTTSQTFPNAITSMGSHHHDPDMLIGLTNGDLYRSAQGSSGGAFKICLTAPVAGAATVIRFADDRTAYVGYSTGVVVKLTDPFTSVRFQLLDMPGTTGSLTGTVAIDTAAGMVHIAQADAVARLSADDRFVDLTGPTTSGPGEQLHAR